MQSEQLSSAAEFQKDRKPLEVFFGSAQQKVLTPDDRYPFPASSPIPRWLSSETQPVIALKAIIDPPHLHLVVMVLGLNVRQWSISMLGLSGVAKSQSSLKTSTTRLPVRSPAFARLLHSLQ